MTGVAGDDSELDDALVTEIRECLRSHPVSFAMIFGSVARGTTTDTSDVDLAVEFDSLRPTDEGYSDAYLRLRSDLNESLGVDVDVVDVWSMSPAVARAAFDRGRVVLGTEDRRETLEAERALPQAGRADARQRVAAALERLTGANDNDRGTVSE